MGIDPARAADPSCSSCGGPAVYTDRVSGRSLCDRHFLDSITCRVRETIRSQGMIAPGDRIAVAFSGGKDSTALLLLLAEFLADYRDASLVALTIDEGIAGYRGETVHAAEACARRLKIWHRVITFTELYGDPLDVLVKDRAGHACSICGILRKHALEKAASSAGATRLATGHNLDDEAQSVLMNAFRGDFERLVRNSSSDSSGLFIPRIKPLCRVSEKEITVYLMLRGAWTDLPECPYTQFALRREVRGLLSGFERRYPGTMLRLLASRKEIMKRCGDMPGQGPIRRCTRCSDPCSGDLCQVCALMDALGR